MTLPFENDTKTIIKPVSYTHLDVYKRQVVMITHNNEIARLADRIVRIEDGRIVE